jgi:6-phosphofructokinase 1
VVEEAHGGHAERLGGAAKFCGDELARLTAKETRHVVLGHLQRGGAPTAFDRTLATRFGGKAVELVLRGQFGKMVANHPPELVPVPLGEVVGRTKLVPLDYDLLQTARMMGISFGD